MTEKRYVFDPSITHFTDTKTGKEYCEYNLDKVVDILNEQEELIKRLKQIREEQTETILKQKRKIKELTTQLTTDDEDVCFYCKHMYLVQQNDGYYISKCKKGHVECSKEDVTYCKDFNLKGDE